MRLAWWIWRGGEVGGKGGRGGGGVYEFVAEVAVHCLGCCC